jgi:hypothetical protein
MSVGPLGGIANGAAGAPLAQTKGSELERGQQDSGVQQRQAFGDQRADSAAGIGEADGQDHETAERDADGRRILEKRPGHKPQEPATDEAAEPPPAKDVTGQSGNQLDLSG